VYRAVLREGGAEVAIKVQRPAVEPVILRDLFIFRALGALASPWTLRQLGCNAELIVDEFGEKLLEELDYVQEARNIEDFGANFAGDAAVKIPWVRRDLSGPKVLVMEWIDGIRCTDVEGLRTSGIDLNAFIRTGVVSGMRQLLEFGLFHGDPHPGDYLFHSSVLLLHDCTRRSNGGTRAPVVGGFRPRRRRCVHMHPRPRVTRPAAPPAPPGNIFALRDGRIAYVDFGNVAELSQRNKEVLIDAVVHAVNKDYEGMAQDFMNLGFLAPGTDVAPIVPALEKIWADSLGRSLADFNFRSVTSKFNELVFQYPIRIPERYSLVIRSLLTQEGICMTLDRGFHFLEVAYPYVGRNRGRTGPPARQRGHSPRRLAHLKTQKPLPGSKYPY
jgi:predicted unusual protein kinase regulating ubiquinone biosynthesis (AarF/ABC1/UbiB family)